MTEYALFVPLFILRSIVLGGSFLKCPFINFVVVCGRQSGRNLRYKPKYLKIIDHMMKLYNGMQQEVSSNYIEISEYDKLVSKNIKLERENATLKDKVKRLEKK